MPVISGFLQASDKILVRLIGARLACQPFLLLLLADFFINRSVPGQKTGFKLDTSSTSDAVSDLPHKVLQKMNIVDTGQPEAEKFSASE